MTSPGIAEFMATLFSFKRTAAVQLLDPGAGQGALSRAFIAEWRKKTTRTSSLHLIAYEIDPDMLRQLSLALRECVLDQQRSGRIIDTDIQPADFIEAVANPFEYANPGVFTHAILNPPYKKINSHSMHRIWLRDLGIETVNLYSGFVAVALQLLGPGGQLVAIIPRSFCNGPYYQPFRKMLLRNAAIERIHLFESRTKAFQADGVLQENIIIKLIRGGKQGAVEISTSQDDSFQDMECRKVPYEEVVQPDDDDKFIRIPQSELTGEEQLTFSFDLQKLGLRVSTGPVVDYRLKDYLLDRIEGESVPLIYACHFADGRSRWPEGSTKKKGAIRDVPETHRWLYPTGCYVVTRRLSSKEEPRRIIAHMVVPGDFPGHEWIGFENHLNVFHTAKNGMEEELARGLCTYLNSTRVDRYFRLFNGHTQVNAMDLRKLPYPSPDQLRQLGRQASRIKRPSQAQIDSMVEELNER
ncbi:MAG: SAM-dependent methyltransferase [Lentisphaerae bacterium]|nr:SAM-dependent methyltransferase [Lentisphaerota bacterium]